jgi:ATP-binding cassette subfamily C (CFTR/MRP) protein 1
MGAIACLVRVQKYLLSENMVDLRSSSQDHPPQLSPSSPVSRIAEITEKDAPLYPLSLGGFASHNFDLPGADISVKDGSFRWTPDGPLIIQNNNVQINPSQIVMVVGNTGSGKSTFLKSLLSETLTETGTISVADSKIAYYNQTPWLTNATIRENIVTFSEFDSDWYNDVVRCCVLEEDFSQLPQGDASRLGSKGITLSGGQKQRVVSDTSTLLGDVRKLTHHVCNQSRPSLEQYTQGRGSSFSTTS